MGESGQPRRSAALCYGFKRKLILCRTVTIRAGGKVITVSQIELWPLAFVAVVSRQHPAEDLSDASSV